MKAFLITDDVETKVGLRLSGVDGVLVSDRENAEKAIYSALENTDIAVLMITDGIYELVPETDELAKTREKPVICRIPDSKTAEDII